MLREFIVIQRFTDGATRFRGVRAIFEFTIALIMSEFDKAVNDVKVRQSVVPLFNAYSYWELNSEIT